MEPDPPSNLRDPDITTTTNPLSARSPSIPRILESAQTATVKMPSEAGHRLYVKGRHLSYVRNKHTTHPKTSLIKIEGVDDPTAANFYLGKRIAYVYKGQKEIRGTKIRVIWGKVTRPHGNSGVVRAKFSTPLPARSFGASVRIMLYPSSI